MRQVTLSDNTRVPALGLGTYGFGELNAERARDVDAVIAALNMGYRLIDTAEIYGSGGSERVVGEAIARAISDGLLTRDDVFVVSKVLPSNASRRGVPKSCEASCKRLGLDVIDLYLLHWRGSVPLAETVQALEALREAGRIRRWGVSNFDVADMEELFALPGGSNCVVNQVYYSVEQRGIEFDLLPWQRARGVATMAYSPLGKGSLHTHAALVELARTRGISAAQLALAFSLRQHDVMSIPKAGRIEHLQANWDAAAIKLSDEDSAAIDQLFSPPKRKHALAMA